MNLFHNRGAVIFFFFFFSFDGLYYINEVQQAFKQICMDKMLSDGYFDMSVYIFGRIKKDEMYARLTAHKSKYAVLYQGPYPKQDTAVSEWRAKIKEDENNTEKTALTYEEASAIVNWVYRSLRNAQEREDFTRTLLKEIKELHHIQSKIRFSNGVVYNTSKVELHFFTSVSGVSSFVSSLRKNTDILFYRGHANSNYILRPSVMRTPGWQENESRLYHELLINCPEDFEKCDTHLEKLVKMQHYGLPTRLLDITRNLLVALFFACESEPENYGELVLISANHKDIKYPQSDTVSILSSLPVFSKQKQQEFYYLAKNAGITKPQFNARAARLIHEVRLEKPAFQPEINKDDILNSYIVYALKNNNRIVKQDGAFILCGLSENNNFLEKFRYREHGKKVIILINKKKKILEQLETFSINRATLFPEIECVSEYLKNKYSL